MIPEGREGEFPNMVFKEQVQKAIFGNALDINVAALSLLEEQKLTQSTANFDTAKHLLSGIENRL